MEEGRTAAAEVGVWDAGGGARLMPGLSEAERVAKGWECGEKPARRLERVRGYLPG